MKLSKETSRVLEEFAVPSSAWDVIGMTGFSSKEVARAIHICRTAGLIVPAGYDDYGEQLFVSVTALGVPEGAAWGCDEDGVVYFRDRESGEKVRLRVREEGQG
jgi:hypothetical protein